MEFIAGCVPVAVAARVYQKDASWVRAGLIAGWLPIGQATRKGVRVTKIDEIARTSSQLSDEENEKEIERAIDEIIRYDFQNIYKKVFEKDETQ